ncbi:VWA domain-containing protein [Candidatus Mycobacterium wuenschmannii]|uniref:VWA domain-containing protein n=1 Tax=Candidatus Mycobacterium wuenschmannii TaxID=3027808 RepID=A0ABY8VWJ7_9MYCO|nr:VWA domain-containing protein [Candidatus Mycobacterium wuenschmannii]WIM87446.1 VWA domain-containing protein [Candidatus Mycobacterium wuenschmannii]
MPNQSLTKLVFLLDRSGSMQSIKSDIIGGFEEFIAEQRGGEGLCTATLAQFDEEYEVVYRNIAVGQVPPLALFPRGRTALHDSMGRLITDTVAEINVLPEADRPGSVVVGIMTDGLENASREWGRAAIRALVEQQTKEHRWEFFYMGADQDAVEVGTGLGIKAEQSVTYARGKSREALKTVSENVRGYRNARLVDPAAAMPAFTDAQRDKLAEE